MNNREIAAIFEKIADMLAIRGDNYHRILAYRRAAESVRGLGRDIMGVKTEDNILAAIAALERHGDDRTPLWVAWPVAQELLEELEDVPGVLQAAAGGSLRRVRETIGDIDLLVAAQDSGPVMERFKGLPQVETVVVSGPSKTTVQLHNGLQVDLRVLPPERWGTLLSYFTGSKAHNVRLRELALKQGLSLNEHAFRPVVDGEPVSEGEILCATEEEVYDVLDLPYIDPRLREDHGEIEAAQRSALPHLVQLEDIVADLQMHTTWSDGKLSVLEMGLAAKERGLRYIAITDHSAGLGIANGLTVERDPRSKRRVGAGFPHPAWHGDGNQGRRHTRFSGRGAGEARLCCCQPAC
jgi:DNA polymerase (family 10)